MSGPFSRPFKYYGAVSVSQNLRFGIDSNPASPPFVQSFPFQRFTSKPLDLMLLCEQLVKELFVLLSLSTV